MPEGEISDTGGEDEAKVGSGGPDWKRSGGAPGAKNPTWRTLGSITAREARRESIVKPLRIRVGAAATAVLR